MQLEFSTAHGSLFQQNEFIVGKQAESFTATLFGLHTHSLSMEHFAWIISAQSSFVLQNFNNFSAKNRKEVVSAKPIFNAINHGKY